MRGLLTVIALGLPSAAHAQGQLELSETGVAPDRKITAWRGPSD